MHPHVHTHVKWLLGRRSAASDRARQRERRETQHMQNKRGRKKNKSTARDHPGIVCVYVCVLPTPHTHTYTHTTLNHYARHNTEKHSALSALLLKHSVAVSTWCHVQKIAFFLFVCLFFRQFTFMDCWTRRARCPTCLWRWWGTKKLKIKTQEEKKIHAAGCRLVCEESVSTSASDAADKGTRSKSFSDLNPWEVVNHEDRGVALGGVWSFRITQSVKRTDLGIQASF